MRANIELKRAELKALEKSLADLAATADRLAVARETALTLEAKAAEAAGANQRARTTEAQQAPEQGTDGLTHPSLGPLSDKILTLIVTSGRSWRAREVAEAIGEPNATRDRVHSIRNTLARLVELGYLERAGAGLYSAPTNRTGAR